MKDFVQAISILLRSLAYGALKPFVITLRHFIVFLAQGCIINIGSNSVVNFTFRGITLGMYQAKMCPVN